MPLFGPPDVDKLKARGNVRGLIRALGYKRDPTIPRAAAQALVDLGHGRSALEELRNTQDAYAVEPLIVLLKQRDGAGIAAIALGRIGDVRAVEPLITVLEGKDSGARRSAAEALGQIGDSRALSPLIAALGDSEVRGAAARALGMMGTPAVDPLIAALQHGDGDVREAAARALGQMGSVSAADPLVAVLGDMRLSGAAAEALERIGKPAIEPLVAALKDTETRERAVKVLGNLGWHPDKTEMGALYCVERREWDRCVEVGAPAVGPLIVALEDGDWRVQRPAAVALG